MGEDNRRYYLMNIVLPLGVGLLIYVFIGGGTIISDQIGKVVPIEGVQIQKDSFWLIEMIRNYLPDALWAYSLAFAVAGAAFKTERELVTAFLLCFIFETVLELLQKSEAVPGTLDYIDIALEAAATAVALLRLKKYLEERT